jgi:hypothetical protein
LRLRWSQGRRLVEMIAADRRFSELLGNGAFPRGAPAWKNSGPGTGRLSRSESLPQGVAQTRSPRPRTRAPWAERKVVVIDSHGRLPHPRPLPRPRRCKYYVAAAPMSAKWRIFPPRRPSAGRAGSWPARPVLANLLQPNHARAGRGEIIQSAGGRRGRMAGLLRLCGALGKMSKS